MADVMLQQRWHLTVSQHELRLISRALRLRLDKDNPEEIAAAKALCDQIVLGKSQTVDQIKHELDKHKSNVEASQGGTDAT